MTNTTKKPKIVFISQSIRRDSHAPLKYFTDFEVVHFYLEAPYGDMSSEDLKGAKQVTLKNLTAEIIKEKPDIIQGAEPFGSKLALRLAMKSLKACKQTGAKLVVPIFENRPIVDRFNLVQRAVLKAFCPGYFGACAAIVCLNKGAITNVTHYCPKAKIVTGIIWGVWGVDENIFHPSAAKVKGKIIYVGRLVEEKGLNYLLRGFLGAVKKIKYLSLQVVGGGPLENDLKEFVNQNDLKDKVEFTGIIKNKYLSDRFSSAELCIYPSIAQKRWEEQVGTVNFQAMACGTPVITTISGAIPEYVKEGEGAILVKEKDAKAIENSIVRFFEDVDLKKSLTQTANKSAKQYDVRVQISKAQDLLNKVIGR